MMGKILVVEDDRDIREGLLEFLGIEGFDAIAAAQGREALEILESSRAELPSLILLDLMMPTMDGRQFREEQLRRPELAQIPVVVMSADNAVRERSDALRASGHLRKPIDLDTLLEIVRRYVLPA
jgi:CheY-like chemotaxis protein